MVEYGLANGLMAWLFLMMLPLIVRPCDLAGLSITLSPALLIVSAVDMGVMSFRLRRVLQPAFPDPFIPSASDDVLPTTQDAERSAPGKVSAGGCRHVNPLIAAYMERAAGGSAGSSDFRTASEPAAGPNDSATAAGSDSDPITPRRATGRSTSRRSGPNLSGSDRVIDVQLLAERR